MGVVIKVYRDNSLFLVNILEAQTNKMILCLWFIDRKY